MYIIISNLYIKEVTVIRREGDMCLIRFNDGEGGIRIHDSRLYNTKAEAAKALPKRSEKSAARKDLGPWAYMH